LKGIKVQSNSGWIVQVNIAEIHMPKPQPKTRNRDADDIRADDPDRAMQQFTEGLKRVIAAPKPKIEPPKRKSRRA
jgi:hypothetical protein